MFAEFASGYLEIKEARSTLLLAQSIHPLATHLVPLVCRHLFELSLDIHHPESCHLALDRSADAKVLFPKHQNIRESNLTSNRKCLLTASPFNTS